MRRRGRWTQLTARPHERPADLRTLGPLLCDLLSASRVFLCVAVRVAGGGGGARAPKRSPPPPALFIIIFMSMNTKYARKDLSVGAAAAGGEEKKPGFSGKIRNHGGRWDNSLARIRNRGGRPPHPDF